VRLPPLGPGETIVGVAVAVPEPFCGQLHDARLRFGDPEARNIVPHVTLIGPTPVADDDFDELDAHLTRIAAGHAPFKIRLRGAETFRPVSPVVYVALEAGAEQCAALESELRVGALRAEARFPFHPHITVAHDLDDAALDAAQAAMTRYEAVFDVTHVHRFVYDGTAWRPARRFLLGAVGTADAPEDDRT